MKPNKNLKKYKENNILTASKEAILLMLYEGAIRFAKQGILALEQGKVEARSKNLMRAQDIVNELRCTLDFKTGGEIAANLERLYDYVSDRLIQGNIKQEKKPLQEAVETLETLHATWKEAIDSLKKDTPKAQRVRSKAMQDVIQYLELKNQYYEKFLEISRKFLDEMVANRWDDFDYFVDNRERLINIIQYCDHRIAKSFQGANPPEDVIAPVKEKIRALFSRRRELGDAIVKQDMQLLACIEDVRMETIQELKRTQQLGQKLGSFNTPSEVPSILKNKDA